MSETVLLSPAALTYLTEVGAALGDLGPTDRGELLDEVQEHLLAITEDSLGQADDAEALIARLGQPLAYAAELRSAAGLPPAVILAGVAPIGARAAGQSLSPAMTQLLSGAWAYLRSLAPAWWALRGLLVSGLLFTVLVPVAGRRPTGWQAGLVGTGGASGGIAGAGPYIVVVIVAVMVVSVLIGLRQSAGRWVWLMNQTLNLAGIITVVMCPMWWIGPSLYSYYRGRYGSA